MPTGQYVQDNGNGTFTTVINGVATYTGDKATAEQNYNLQSAGLGFSPYSQSGASYTAQPAPAATGGGNVAQMRADLARHDPRWNTRSDADVAAEWTRLRNASTAPRSGGMTLAGGLDQATLAGSLAQQAAQQQYLRDRLNQLEIPMSQAERQQAYAKLAMDMAAMTGYYGASAGAAPGTQNTEEQALDAIAGSRDAGFWDFYKSNGYTVDTPEQKRAAVQNWITSADPRWKGMSAGAVASALGLGGATAGAEWAGLGGVAAGAAGATPTFAREQFNAQNWQNVANLLASKSGPRDWATYQQLQPKAAFGAMTGTPSWEQALAQWFNGGQTAGNVDFPQPNTMRAQDWAALSPTGREMTLGAVQAAGIDAQDWEKNMRSGWPTGRAPLTTSWGG